MSKFIRPGSLVILAIVLIIVTGTLALRVWRDHVLATVLNDPWRVGRASSTDGTQLQIYCSGGEWNIGFTTIERLVPPSSSEQWVNRDVTFQFDNDMVQRTKGTLHENRLNLSQDADKNGISLNYGQDAVAGILRGKYKLLTVRLADGDYQAKQWQFDLTDAHRKIPNDKSFPCPRPEGLQAGQ